MQHRVVMSMQFLVLAAASGLAGAQDAKPVVAVAQPLERESREFEFAARLEAPTLLEIRSPRSGVIATIFRKPGEAVKKGDEFLEYSRDSVQEELRRAGEEVQNAERTAATL